MSFLEIVKPIWDGFYLGIALIFGTVWTLIKTMPWWAWLILIAIALIPAKRYYSPRYRSKTYIDEKGYERFSDSDKLVSRWVVEKKLGRRLDVDEEVHHRNRNKLDNRPSNLEALYPEEHNRKHGYTDDYNLEYDEDNDDYDDDF
jgi:hypothetical protein